MLVERKYALKGEPFIPLASSWGTRLGHDDTVSGPWLSVPSWVIKNLHNGKVEGLGVLSLWKQDSGYEFRAWWYQAHSTTWTQAVFGQSQLQCLTPYNGNRSWTWLTLGGLDIMASPEKLFHSVQKTKECYLKRSWCWIVKINLKRLKKGVFTSPQEWRSENPYFFSYHFLPLTEEWKRVMR